MRPWHHEPPDRDARSIRIRRGEALAVHLIDDRHVPFLRHTDQDLQGHGAVFEAGTSTKAIVEDAVRYYQFEQRSPRVVSRASVLISFSAQVGALVNSKAEATD